VPVVTRKTIFIFIGLLIIAAIVYYSNQPHLNVEPHAAQEIEKAKKR
jgi:uncharacterized membrane protein